MSELLTVETVTAYLAERGTTASATGAAQLAGGVSNVVLSVDTPDGGLVVKQSLGQLRVADLWLAPRRRILSEAAAIDVAARITPDATPALVDVDSDRMTITIRRAPAGWRDWKSSLLAGDVDPSVGRTLGSLLGAWHRGTAGGANLPARLTGDPEAFELLRLRPYHETVAERLPEVAGRVRGVAQQMRETRTCLVHGDFSPKNILVGQQGVWVIDFEVAQLGDPTFDVAFLASHLLLKSLRRATDAARLDATVLAFATEYALTGPASEPEHVSDQVACLLLARLVGKSPVDYLDPTAQDHAHRLAMSLLDHPASSFQDLFDRRQEARP